MLTGSVIVDPGTSETRDRPVGRPHEAVDRKAAVLVEPRDRPLPVDAKGLGGYRSRRIETP